MSWLALEGKTAVVTGGASGIGKAVVQAFLDNGANVVVCDKALYLARQMLFQSCLIPWAVQKEGSSVYQFLNHVVFVHIGRIVAGNKVCLVDQVCGLDR